MRESIQKKEVAGNKEEPLPPEEVVVERAWLISSGPPRTASRETQADREEEIKLELLDASLKQVSIFSNLRMSPALVQVMKYGWSKEAVRAAAEDLGRPSVVAGLVKVLKCLFVCSTPCLQWFDQGWGC